ncbi:MAG: indole-3-glycerol phosphate synthase TrpC [Pseudomonadota bacterium]|nr:indole-3-glycerol phosphate synthase TrpC [Pseudomonadota bacterium]
MKENLLARIMAAKAAELAETKRLTPLRELRAILGDLPPPRNFREALTGRGSGIIAEIKKASPSRGIIREAFDPRAIAGIYEAHGAAAISVLTERSFFQGHGRFLEEIRKTVGLPLLRKDFLIDPYQVYETRRLGGDALLLIARALPGEILADLVALTQELGMTPLVEVRNGEELARGLAAGAPAIGVNNRDLASFVTDLGVSLRLAPSIPAGVVKVSESGIARRRDVELLRQAGYNAFLVGEALMRAEDIGGKLRELRGEEVRP